MVEYSIDLDNIFHALADATRRDILARVSKRSLTISELADSYKMSFAGIAKHIVKLEAAKLVIKKKVGRQQVVSVVPGTVGAVSTYLNEYTKLWDSRFNALDDVLNN